MPHLHVLDFVRCQVIDALSRRSPEAPGLLRESLLIRAGLYCGRRFDTDDGYAIWFAEEMQVKVYERGGQMIEVLCLNQEDQQPRPALLNVLPHGHRLAA